jgi:hypothetical protein
LTYRLFRQMGGTAILGSSRGRGSEAGGRLVMVVVVSVRVEVGEHHVPVTRSSNKVALETQTLPILHLQTLFQASSKLLYVPSLSIFDFVELIFRQLQGL